MKDTHDYFDDELVARFLRNHHTGIDNLGRHYLANIIKQYDNPTILDVACGTCVNWEVFKLLKVPCTYIGYDRTQKLLDHATKLYGDEIQLIQGYAQELNNYFQSNSVDVVILRHILEHIPNGEYQDIIRQALKIAKKELIIVFFETPTNDSNDTIEERGPDERGCFYWWNKYSMPKFLEFVDSINGKLVDPPICIETPFAAAPDTILRVKQCPN